MAIKHSLFNLKTAFVLVLVYSNLSWAQNQFPQFKNKLDHTLSNDSLFLERKNKTLTSLKEKLHISRSNQERYPVLERIYEEYKSFQSDSALVYAEKSKISAAKNNNSTQLIRAQLNYASILGTLGRYDDALSSLNELEHNLKESLKGEFYWTKRIIYGGLTEYGNSKAEKTKYNQLGDYYRDLAVANLSKNTTEYTVALAGQLFSKRKYPSALRLLLAAFEKIGKTDSNRAVIAYLISENYRLLNDKGQEKNG